ncbi:Trichodiene synthase-like protein [Hapsidospora chrysogenum ATCC 11550]|uniref:Trichodiene synthase-like protein n=1 Tax=Hapsidospora chrysogenum (strain ATCC 11550 / CBS 779.69 / DSM 880 / IAM 14645 / JCM 23072 / IMI 49137) TaxID=857340 RepID=A0A086T038_HAPC1|nr:Trichodiene synthase-like protein [Hapsidospora chrysogenum ATCC 11550]
MAADPTVTLSLSMESSFAKTTWNTKYGRLTHYLSPNPWVGALLFAFVAILFRYRLGAKGRLVDMRASPDTRAMRATYEKIINEFLRDISFKPPTPVCTQELRRRVKMRLRQQGVSEADLEGIQGPISTGVKITSFSYPYVSLDAQEYIACYAAYVISIDDLTRELAGDLRAFATRLALGQPHGSSLLRGFTSYLGEQGRVFGPFGGDMVIKGTLEFISSTGVEEIPPESLHLPPEAADFLNFFRAKTGVAEPFAFFFFPEDILPESTSLERYVAAVPSIMLLLGYINDILSFYKEEVVAAAAAAAAAQDDSASFIRSHSKLHGISTLESLRRTKVETVQVVEKLRGIFAEDKVLLGYMDQFVQGYVMYHLSCNRYKLGELDIPLMQTCRA